MNTIVIYVVMVHDPNSSDPVYLDGAFGTEEEADAYLKSPEFESDKPDADSWGEVVSTALHVKEIKL